MSKAQQQNLPLVVPREAWQALADTAKALLAVASAMLGEVSVSAPLSLSPLPSFADAPSLAQVVNELLQSKARAGRSDDYLKNLRIALKRFVQAMNNRQAQAITYNDVVKWLDRLPVGAKAVEHHRDAVRLMFNYAKKCGYIRENPAGAIELPDSDDDGPPLIHTPEQVRHVLETMRKADLDVCRFLSIRYFAGLRGSETQALTPDKIMLERGFIEASSRKGNRGRRRRLVTIQPNLRDWLALGGHLPLTDKNNRMAAVAKLTGVPWKSSVTRHSFCSYHLAEFQNAAKTALEAGHSEEMLFGHYRELVTPDSAKEFWAIRPA